MSATESPAEIMERLRREREEVHPRGVLKSVAVAITGGRDYEPTPGDMERFWELFTELGANELHHGDSRGVDRYVAAAVRKARPGLRIVAHSARWDLHGKRAGPLRNQEMMVASSALIAFPGGKGTRSCEEAARHLGRPVHFIVAPPVPQVIEPRPRPGCQDGDHQVKNWRWSPGRAMWAGCCAVCGREILADRQTADLLERLAAAVPYRASA